MGGVALPRDQRSDASLFEHAEEEEEKPGEEPEEEEEEEEEPTVTRGARER